MLRRRVWFDTLVDKPGMWKRSPDLPRVPRAFVNSSQWGDQLYTLKQDYKRMPQMGNLDVVSINARYASNMHALGYTQGYLYLLRSLYLVFGNDEPIVYWSFVALIDIVRPYGPVGKSMGGPRGIRRVIEYADPAFDVDLMIDLVTVRWGFIIFSQTFVDDACLLCVWDAVVRDKRYIQCIIASMLQCIRFDAIDDPMVRLQMTCDQRIDCVNMTSHILSVATQVHQRWYGEATQKRFRAGRSAR